MNWMSGERKREQESERGSDGGREASQSRSEADVAEQIKDREITTELRRRERKSTD